MSQNTLTDVPVDLIDPQNNDREEFDPDELKRLATSIRRVGQITPILIRPREDDPDRYWLIAGERRWRAHKILGKPTITAQISADDDQQAKVKMLVENMVRTDLNPIEEAKAFRVRIDEYGATVKSLAEEAGVWPVLIRDRLKLLNLEPEIQSLIASGQITHATGDAMHDLTPDRQFAALALRGKLGHSDFWALCDKMRNEQAAQPLFDKADFELRQQEIIQEVRQGTGEVHFKEFVHYVDRVLAAYRELIPDEQLIEDRRADLRVIDATLDYRIVSVQKRQRVSAPSEVE